MTLLELPEFLKANFKFGENVKQQKLSVIAGRNLKDYMHFTKKQISLLSKGFSRVFSNTTVQKHQFFGAQSSLWPNSHIRIWLLEKP